MHVGQVQDAQSCLEDPHTSDWDSPTSIYDGGTIMAMNESNLQS